MSCYGVLQCLDTCNRRSWLHISTSSLVLVFLNNHHILVNDTYGPSPQIVHAAGAYVILLLLRDHWSVIVSMECLQLWDLLWCIDAVVVIVLCQMICFTVMNRVVSLSWLFPYCCVLVELINGLYFLALFVSHGIIVFTVTTMYPPWIIYRLECSRSPR
jgi:hypothetical protein